VWYNPQAALGGASGTVVHSELQYGAASLPEWTCESRVLL